jgi:uncharacterized protein (TIGR02449 family)
MQNFDKPDLNGLEYQIDSLVRTIHQLQLENHSLRNKLTNSQRDFSRLEEKNHRLAERIQKIINHLKEEMA